MNPSKPPIKDPASGLRQRWRARTGDWRIWWEPSASARKAGMQTVELDGDRLTWSNREAAKLAAQADRMLSKSDPAGRRSKAPGKNSIDALVTSYLAPKNRLFHKNSDAHKKNVQYDIGRILDVWSGTAVRNLSKPVIHTWYENLYADHGARMAQRLIGTLSTLLSYATLKGMIEVNPLIRMGMETPKPRTRLVTWAEYDALQKAAADLNQRSMALCMALSMFMGQRETDCWTVKAGAFIMQPVTDGGEPQLVWRIIRSKDRKRKTNHLLVHPECLPLVRSAIQRQRDPKRIVATIDPDADIVVQDNTGNPMNEHYFQKVFAKVRKLAAKTTPSVATVQFRDLRRTFSNNSRHAGMVDTDIDDALGNTAGTDPALRQVYMPASDERAAAAILAVQRPATKDTTEKRA